MIYRVLISIISITLFSSCSETNKDTQLIHISEIVSESPEEALSYLDSIHVRDLSEADQYLYDFLTIKATDKNFIRHTSDSTILRVIKYYSSNDKDVLYPEVLYYGGRVYSDLGESPTALKYFQMALENLPESPENINLKANILSQTGRLLTGISLYDEAIPYIEQAIEIDKYNNDTVNLVHDFQLLGGTYLRAKNYRKSEQCFNITIDLCYNLPESYIAKSRMYLADIKYQSGQLDSALNFIRNTPDLVSPIARNRALATASEIYLENGLLDSAYMYAKALLNSKGPNNKEIAYQVLLSPQFYNSIPHDTLYQYISDYRELLEIYYDSNNMQLAINQQNFFNYHRHVVEREKLEANNLRLTKWIFGISSLCFFLITIVLYYKNKHKKALIELHIAIKNIDKLNRNIVSKEYDNSKPVENTSLDLLADNLSNKSLLTTESEKALRDKLRDKLLYLYNNNASIKLSEEILESDAYRKLMDFIRNKQTLSYESPLWNELEEVVIKSSPNFKYNLHLLTQSRLTTIDLHTVLLVKCHILPSQMAILLSKSKGAIVSRRESLCAKILGVKLGTKVIDGIIRLL